MKAKVCKECKELKPLEEYYKRSALKDGHRGECKVCRNKKLSDNYCPERQRDISLRTKYGITLDDYNQMREDQDYKCVTCGCPEGESKTSNGYKLVVDHCHEHRHVRGLLCNNCNLALGYIKDDVVIAAELIKYLTERGG